MKFAVMTFMYGHWWRDGLLAYDAMIEGFAELGVEGLESFQRDFVDTPALVADTQRVLAATGLRMAAIDIICNLVCATPEQRREAREQLRFGLDLCVELGAEIAHVAGHRLRAGVSAADGRKMIADGLAEHADFAAANGLTLAIEDFDPAPDLVCCAADCLEILELSRGTVEFVFDTGNFEAVEERADENFSLLRDRICHCHFKDFVRVPGTHGGRRGTHLGQGVVPNAAVAKLLRQAGFNRWVALESYPQDGAGPLATVARELPLLKSWFA